MFNEVDFSSDFFCKLIDLVDVNIYWKNKEGRYLGCNRSVLNRFGLKTAQDIIGKTDFEALLIPENELAPFLEHDKFALLHGAYEGEEFGTINGERRTYSTKKVRFTNKDGEVAGLIGISSDITDQKKLIAEEQLRHAQIIDSVRASIYWKDEKGEKYLGCNQYVLNMFGLKTKEEIVGKSEYDLLSKEEAQKITKIDQSVLITGYYEGEERFTLPSGEEKVYLTFKNRLINSENMVVGLVGTSLDITAQKKLDELDRKKLITEEQLRYEQIIDSVCASIYWKDKKGDKLLGCNQYMLDMAGLKTREEIIGKNEYDFLSAEEAQQIAKVDQFVLATGHFEGEESFTLPNGEEKVYFTVKNRLFDSENNVIGMVGTSLDITAQKEADQLKLENTRQQAIIEETEKFRKLVDQVAHDIRSPLSSMAMILQASNTMPEKERLGLRFAATKITDIAHNLLRSYDKQANKSDPAPVTEEREALLISPVILETLTEKRYQFQNLPVTFDHHFTQNGNFAWIRIESTAFKRMLSNVINNAVDAFDGKEGKVTVHIDTNSAQVRIIVEDNGKGMRPELVQKILNRTAVTEGKQDGHGIGLTQVRETLQNNEGELSIESQVGSGTKMILTFPGIPAQDWIADSMQLNDGDTVVVLDDDSSIHVAWSTRFDVLMKKFPRLTVKHFERGQDTVDYINSLSPEEARKVFLLTDYELLKQGMNGLDVIDKTRAGRTILVTSHYANKQVRRDAAKAGTTILPKQLAYDIPIHVWTMPFKHVEQNRIEEQNSFDDKNSVDAVFVDDEQYLLDSFCFAFGQDKKIATHCDPKQFLANVDQYPKNTRIMLDFNFSNFELNGFQIAEKLHTLGYTRLYVLSGMNSFDHPMPHYLTPILKTDLEHLAACLK